MWYKYLIALSSVILASCASKAYHINLMAVPSLYASGTVDPFRSGDPFASIPYRGVLYATDREPKSKLQQPEYQQYASTSGFALRLGRSEVRLGDGTLDWKSVKEETLSAKRSQQYPMRISSSTEFGILRESIAPLVAGALSEEPDPADAFIQNIADSFTRSSSKQIHIYVPGARSPFDSAILIGSEMWHYLGYDGVMIAYAWPAQPKGIGLSYFGDAETATSSSRNLRLLLEYLARETEVDKINLVTYSAGGRIVLGALSQLALKGVDAKQSKIGNVILAGSDVADTTFGGYVADGLLSVFDRLTVYASSKDLTLGIAEFVFGRQRIGQISDDGNLDPLVQDYLLATNEFDIVDVTSVSTDEVPFGHSYFRSSADISSDILAILLYGLSPAERGLIRQESNPVWTVPNDYANKLRASVVSQQRQ